jgi:FADH2-dependent halogenase/halogenation protein CepH
MPAPKTNGKYEAIIIGAGPAGATCAYALAKQGHSVLLLEKAQHPRFHIGESLVPYLLGLWENLGLLDRIKQEKRFLFKAGVEVSDKTSPDAKQINFNVLKKGQQQHAFNVDRPRLDQILTDAAAEAGANVQQNATVKQLLFDGDRMNGVAYEQGGRTQEVHARYVVDASGRAGLISRQFSLRRVNPRLRNIAFFNHFHDADWEKNGSGSGYQVVAMHKDGWIWCIPTGERVLSVGTVLPAALTKTAEPDEIFEEHLNRVPYVKQTITHAKREHDTLRRESDFCYHSNRLAGPGWLMAGDAGCFVDPLFSGGVFLASATGARAATAVHNMLGGAKEQEEGTAFENYSKTGYDGYYRLVYGFYEKGTIPELLRLIGAPYPIIVQFLSGNFWGQKNDPVLNYFRAKPEWNTFDEPFDFVDRCTIYPDTYYRAGEPMNPLPPWIKKPAGAPT